MEYQLECSNGVCSQIKKLIKKKKRIKIGKKRKGKQKEEGKGYEEQAQNLNEMNEMTKEYRIFINGIKLSNKIPYSFFSGLLFR